MTSSPNLHKKQAFISFWTILMLRKKLTQMGWVSNWVEAACVYWRVGQWQGAVWVFDCSGDCLRHCVTDRLCFGTEEGLTAVTTANLRQQWHVDQKSLTIPEKVARFVASHLWQKKNVAKRVWKVTRYIDKVAKLAALDVALQCSLCRSLSQLKITILLRQCMFACQCP